MLEHVISSRPIADNLNLTFDSIDICSQIIHIIVQICGRQIRNLNQNTSLVLSKINVVILEFADWVAW